MKHRYKKHAFTSLLMALLLIWSVPAIAQVAEDNLDRFDRNELELIERYKAGDLINFTHENRIIISKYEQLNANTRSKTIPVALLNDPAYEQGFDDVELPDDWENVDESSSGFSWEFEDGTENFVPQDLFSGGFATIDSDAAGMGAHVNASLISEEIDITGLDNVHIGFDHHYRHAGSTASVSVSTDGGTTWEDVAVYTSDQGSSSGFGGPFDFTPVTEVISVSSEVEGASSMWLKFEYDDNEAWAWYWLIDNVVVIDQEVDTNPVFVGAEILNLGTTFVGGMYEVEYEVGNDGEDNLTVDLTSSDSELMVDGLPVTVEFGETETFTVTFDADTEGVYEGVFELSTNDPNNSSVEVDVVSTVQEPMVTGFINEDFNDVASGGLPEGWVGNFVVFTSGGLDDSQRLTRNLWGSAPTGQVGTNFVELGDSPELNLHYRVVNWSGYPGTPTPSENFAFTIYVSTDLASTFEAVYTYDPAEHTETTDYAEISVDLGDFSGETAMLMVSAERIDGDFYLDFDDVRFGTAPSDPILVVSEEEINFGEIFTGDYVMEEFTVSNDGGGSMDVEVESDNSLFIVDGPGTFTLDAGESAMLEVIYNPADNEGDHTGTITVTADGADSSPATISLSGSAVAPPVAGVTPESMSVTADIGDEDVSETLTITNTGSADLEFSIGVAYDEHPEAMRALPEAQRFSYEKKGKIQRISTAAIAAPIVPGAHNINDGHISFEAEEGFDLGFIGGQEGWSTFEDNTAQPVVSDDKATDGDYSLKLDEDPAAAGLVGAFSPTFSLVGDLITISADIYIEATGGSDYELVIQAPSQELLTARVNFSWLGGISVVDFDAGGELTFVGTGVDWAVDEWANIEVVIDVSSESIDYYYNGDHIHEGALFGADTVEQIILLHDNWNDGEVGYFDNITIDADTGWLSMEATSGVVAGGESVDVEVGFLTDLQPAEYIATLLVSTNDPEAGTIYVPVTFTLEGEPEPSIGWANLQWPPEETIIEGDELTVYGKVWADGITGSDEDVEELSMWVGVSSEDTHPETWDEEAWTEGVFNNSDGNDDEYMADIGADLEMGTYYYATRFQYADEAYVYGGSSEDDGGFWEEGVNVSGVLTVEESVSIDNPEVPAVFTLKQNYPNPFNPSTTIRYGLPESADVTLEVYNLLGQRVAVLVNESRTAGYHDITFDASSLSSGMYIYRIQAGSFVETRKLMLVK